MTAAASIVIRTYNEQRYLPLLLDRIRQQETGGLPVEVVLVDSGSTDDTLQIAASFGCRILHIEKEVFSFGRSLNIGCAAAEGRVLVFISGHCIPVETSWLRNLVAPVLDGRVAYAYGKQVAGGASRFAEKQIYAKYFPEHSLIPQEGFFCNNANAALSRDVWSRHRFDEQLTGLEDMHLARTLTTAGMKIGYVAGAPVFHHHHESWAQVRHRFEREAIALQHIMPEIHMSLGDFVRYTFSAIAHDFRSAVRERKLLTNAKEIVLFRFMQFSGAYRGNHVHRQLSRERKERYFYPR